MKFGALGAAAWVMASILSLRGAASKGGRGRGRRSVTRTWASWRAPAVAVERASCPRGTSPHPRGGEPTGRTTRRRVGRRRAPPRRAPRRRRRQGGVRPGKTVPRPMPADRLVSGPQLDLAPPATRQARHAATPPYAGSRDGARIG